MEWGVKTSVLTVCPYYTMFPLRFPREVLRRHARAQDWVLDPFCGRGTTNFAARELGLASVGIDSSPVAAAIAQAKLPRVDASRVVDTARRILSAPCASLEVPEGEFWQLAYHPETLYALSVLRQSLLRRCSGSERVVLRAILLGALHGPLSKGEPSYFSNQCPRTYSPKPAYAVRFWRRRGLQPPRVDVLRVIAARAARYLAEQPPAGRGRVVLGDSRAEGVLGHEHPYSLVKTSPPYYGMRTYIPDQWIRFWFLGGPDSVCYEHPKGEIQHSSPATFTTQLSSVWRNVLQVCRPSVRMVIRFGGINDRKQEPMALLRQSLAAGGWRITTIRSAGTARNGRRQAEQFGRASDTPLAEYDVYARPA